MNAVDLFFWIFVGFSIYMLLKLAIAKAIHPLRVHVIEEIEELVQDETIPETVRDVFKDLSGLLFSAAIGWAMLIALPISVVSTMLKGGKVDSPIALKDHPKKKRIVMVYCFSILCAISSSPLALVVLLVELLILFVVTLALHMSDASMARSMRSAVHRVINANHGGISGNAA